jgi:hypothetical protein
MNFALDINNPRIKSAMETLGIDKEELTLKTFNDFGAKGTRDEIKQLRFDSYSKRLEETVKLIKSTMQSKRSKTKDTTIRTSYEDDFFEESSSQPAEPEKKVFLNDRNKDVLITALESIKDFHIKPAKKERPKSMANPRSLKLSKIEQFKKNQQENYSRILNTQELQVRKALSQGVNSKPAAQTPKVKNTTSKPLHGTIELDVGEALAKLDEKIEKSRVLHEKQILMKKESARTQMSITRLAPFEEDHQNELIFKILEKTRAVSERREKRRQEVQEKWEKIRTFKEQRAQKLQEIESQFRQHMQNKELSLQKKLHAAENIMKNRKASMGKEIELKIEQQKIRDEEALIKLKRAHKIM